MRFLETIFDYEKDIKARLREEVLVSINDSKRNRKTGTIRDFELEKREKLNNLSPVPVDTEESRAEQIRYKLGL